MANFRFRFESLLRYRKHRRDLCRQRLAEVMREEQNLLSQRRELEKERERLIEELRRMQSAGEVDVDGAAARRYYVGRLLTQMIGIEQRRQSLRREIAQCRQAVVRADQDVKVLEKLAEKRRAEFLYEAERREGLATEDAWSAARLGEGGT